MAYRHIDNLYKNKTILYFSEAWAMEKVHGTSAHIRYNGEMDEIHFFSGGSKHESFVALFDEEALLEKFRANAEDHPLRTIIIYGEAYGGSMQKMSDTYGKELKFIAFEVKSGNVWLDVPRAELFVNMMGLEFVPYKRIPTTEEAINREMNADSTVAVRNGCGPGKMREGVVLRPIQEFIHQSHDGNGGPIRAKHKRPEFSERKSTPKFKDPEKLKLIEDAKLAADEFVVMERLRHVLDHLYATNTISNPPEMQDLQKIIKAMLADVLREGEGEVPDTQQFRKAVGKKTVALFKQYMMETVK